MFSERLPEEPSDPERLPASETAEAVRPEPETDFRMGDYQPGDSGKQPTDRPAEWRQPNTGGEFVTGKSVEVTSGDSDTGSGADRPADGAENSSSKEVEIPDLAEPGDSEGGDGGDGEPPESSGEQDPEDRPLRFSDLNPEGHLISRLYVSPEIKTLAKVELGMEDVERFPVSRNNAPWSVDFPGYSPTKIDAPIGASWFTDNPRQVNPYDPEKLARSMVSLETGQEVPRDENGLPLNVCGRTGIEGCGAYNELGPIKSVLDVVTRRNPETNVLEVLATRVPAEHAGQMMGAKALPETLLREGETSEEAVRRLRSERGIEDLPTASRAKTVFVGYADRSEATDNAWPETDTRHTRLNREQASDVTGYAEHDKVWVPVNQLLERDPQDGHKMETHHHRMLELIADLEYREACQPQFPGSTIEHQKNGNVVEHYSVTTTIPARTATGDIVELPHRAQMQRIVSRKYGPAPTIDYALAEEVRFEDLPDNAQMAVQIAEMLEENTKPIAELPTQRQITVHIDDSKNSNLYTAPLVGGRQPILKATSPRSTPDPRIHNKRVRSARSVGSGYVAVPADPAVQSPEKQTYVEGQNIRAQLGKDANAFWVSGAPLFVTGRSDPNLNNPSDEDLHNTRFVIFPVELLLIEEGE